MKPPPTNPTAGSIKMRTSGFVTMQSSIVSPEGLLQGTLDPITGFIPMEQAGVPYWDIVSITVWRTLDIGAPPS